MSKPFADRADAGRVLAEELNEYSGRPDVIVLGLPRGGIPVAYEVALALACTARRFPGAETRRPGQEELAMGAIASGGVVVVNDEVDRRARISREELKAEVENETRELERREVMYRGGHPLAPIEGKTVILIDDGLATGSTMRAALAAVKRSEPSQVVVAVPVGASSTCAELEAIADRCVCAISPENFRSVGLWYEDFAQTTDEEVRELLTRAAARPIGEQPKSSTAPLPDREVTIDAGGRELRGLLGLPDRASAVILFAHGSGSGRQSPRNQYVAQVLQMPAWERS